MESKQIFAVTLVAALGAALLLSNPQQEPAEPEVSEWVRVLSASIDNSTPEHDIISGPATETVVYSEVEGRLIETAMSEYMSTTTTTTASKQTRPTQPPTTAPPTTTTTSPSTTTTVSQDTAAAYEADFYSRINSLRSSNGLAPLTRNGSLNSRARSWAEYLAGIGKLKHSNLAELMPPWTAAGENLAAGGTVSGLFNALAGSSDHRSNMLGDYTHVGIGVFIDGSGTIWTVHVFAHD